MFGERRRFRPGARRWAGRITAAAVAVACATAVAVVVTDRPEAAAAPENFYSPPEQIPAEPGTVIRTQPMSLLATLPSDQGWPG
ncbi:MAG: lipase, partial [Nocardia sp.]|nr:lipase [Nocardia sp.]